MTMTNMEINNLKKEIPYKWKIQSFNRNESKAACVAYIDARDVMDILDEVVGAGNWQDNYMVVGDSFMAGIGIKINDEWIWKWDTGTEGDYEKEKGLISDAFKRAAVKWGVGRFLYDLDIKWIDVKNKRPIDENEKTIWDLTEYFNKQGGCKTRSRSSRENETGKVMINKEDAQLMKDAIEMYPEDKFLKSVGAKLKQYGKLTDNQRKAVEEKIGLAEIDTAVQDEVNAELDMEMEEISKNW